MLILLVSVGLNLGLAWRIYRGEDAAPRLEDRGGFRHGRAHMAHDDSAGWHRMHEQRIGRIARRLDLSAAQVEGFEAAQRETGRLLREKSLLVKGTRTRLLELATEDSLDETAVRETMAILSRQQANLDSLVVETMLEEMRNLDPDQRILYLKMLPLEPGPAMDRRPGRGRRASGQ
jgi:Spy/CpxP family protein refolding chaperone